MYYRTYGFETSKPLIVFLNGTTQTTLYWGTLVPAFSKRFRLLFYDARTQGQSDHGNGSVSLKQHVLDLKDLIANLAVDKVHLVGLSHGARVGLAYAVDYPGIVDHLVLCSLGSKTNARARTLIKSWLEILRTSGLEAMAWAALPIVFGNNFLEHNQKMLDKIVTAVVKRNRRVALLALLESLLQYPPPDKIPDDFNRPTLVISGSEDPIVDPESVRQLAHLCRARHEEIPGIGHSIPAESPRRFENLVIDFLVKGDRKCEKSYLSI